MRDARFQRRVRLATALVLLIGSAAAHAAARVAVVGGVAGGATADRLSLVEAELAGDEDLELLDRQHVQRVLEEQKLVLTGLVDASHAVRVGQVLPVDLFCVLESDPQEAELLGLVVYDAATGARLTDETLTATDVQEQAAQVAGAVRRAAEKFHAGPKELRAVGILTVRNAELPRSADSTVQAVGRLLERWIVRAPQLALLERDRLQHVVRERGLPTADPLPPLLASLALVELEVGRGENADEWTATAQVSDASGRVVATVSASAPAGDAAKLAEELRPSLAVALQAKFDLGREDRRREAERFHRESFLLWQHREFAQAAQAAEAAVALAPADPRFLRTLIYRLGDAAIELVDPGRQQQGGPPREPVDPAGLEQSLALAGHGLDLQYELLRHVTADRRWPDITVEVSIMNYPIYLSKIVAPGRELPESVQAQVEAFIADYREYQLGTVATALREAVSQEGGLRHYTSWVPQPALLDILRHYRPVREDWAADAALLLTQWAGIADEHHPSRDPQLLVSSAYVLSTARWAQRVEGMSESDYQTLRNAYQSIHGLNDPLFRHYGALLLMALDRHMGRLSETEASERVRRLTTDLRPLILPGEDALPARSRDVWIQIAIDAHDLLSIDERTAMGRQLFDDLAAAGYYSERLFERTLIGLAVEERRPDALAMVEQALRLLESGPDGPAESQRPALIEGLRTRRQGLRESLGLLDETVAPWTSVRTLIEVEGAEEGVRGIAAPVVEGRTAYAIGMSWSEDQGWVTLTLLSFDLDTGEPGTLGTYAIENLPVPRPFNAASPDELTLYSVIERSTTDGSDFVRGACVADGQCYVATMGHGILAFPLDGGPPRRIDESAGLPSDYVHALAHHDGRLYAWAGKPRTAAYLVRLDLDGGAPAIIASSRRTVRRTPLDNTGPVQCDLMFADAPRGRIIFRLTHSNSGENLGLWEVGLESDEIRQLWKTHLFLKSGTTARYTGESYVLVRDGADLHRFDLETDEVRRIYHKVTDTPWTFAPFAIVRGDLWVGIPFGRIDLETGRSEQFPPLRAGRFQPGCYVRRLGENELLIGDPSALWLVTLPAENAEPPEPQTQTPRP